MSADLERQAKWEAGGLAFLHRQLLTHPKPVPPFVKLTGQTAIITGGNTGLGFEAMRQLLQLGLSRGILAVRSQSKGDAAAAKLRQVFPNAQIDVWIVDMASYASIRAFAQRCERELDRLDIVVLNAGVQVFHFEPNKDTAHESSFQVNYLSTMLLAILLLPILKAKKQPSQPARLTFVSSDTAFWSKLDPYGPIISRFDSKQRGTTGNGPHAYTWYMDAKLLLIMAMSKLAGYVNSDVVIINIVNPGLCLGTEIFRDPSGAGFGTLYIRPIVFKMIGRNLRTGASTYINAAVVQGAESHGSYCGDWTIKPFPSIMYTEEGQEMKERLWQETMEELKADEVSSIVRHLRT